MRPVRYVKFINGRMTALGYVADFIVIKKLGYRKYRTAFFEPYYRDLLRFTFKTYRKFKKKNAVIIHDFNHYMGGERHA